MHQLPHLSIRIPLLLGLAVLLQSCIGNRIIYPREPTLEQLAAFNAAGKTEVDVPTDQLAAINVSRGQYEVVAGDLLEVDLPVTITGGGADDESSESSEKVRVRINRDGAVRLPQLESLAVVGQTLAEIENAVVAAYYPSVLTEEPNIVVTVAEHRTSTVAVMGAVAEPGIHALRSDRLSLLGALMAAGGIDKERGAESIRILKAVEEAAPNGDDGEMVAQAEPIVLPVRDSTIPFSDISLEGGETIVVEPLQVKQFTALGLVGKPGVHPYPKGVTYNLLQAIAVAGGTNDTSAPRWATIYRTDEGGEIITCTFRIDGAEVTNGWHIVIKAGDVIAVEHTQGTWTRAFLSSILGFRASVSATSAGTL